MGKGAQSNMSQIFKLELELKLKFGKDIQPVKTTDKKINRPKINNKTALIPKGIL